MTTSNHDNAAEPTYPCERCGTPRTKAQGGTVFTVCDVCWDKNNAGDWAQAQARAAFEAEAPAAEAKPDLYPGGNEPDFQTLALEAAALHAHHAAAREPMNLVEIDLAMTAADFVLNTPSRLRALCLGDLDRLARAARELKEARAEIDRLKINVEACAWPQQCTGCGVLVGDAQCGACAHGPTERQLKADLERLRARALSPDNVVVRLRKVSDQLVLTIAWGDAATSSQAFQLAGEIDYRIEIGAPDSTDATRVKGYNQAVQDVRAHFAKSGQHGVVAEITARFGEDGV